MKFYQKKGENNSAKQYFRHKMKERIIIVKKQI